MTQDEVRQATGEAIATVEAMIAHLQRLQARFASRFPLTADAVSRWSDEEREQVYALLRLFEQIYDLTGRRLMRGFVTLSGEDASALSMRNLARRIDTLDGIPSAETWLGLTETRDRSAHEYPLDPAREAMTMNLIWDDLAPLLSAASHLIDRIRQDDLL